MGGLILAITLGVVWIRLYAINTIFLYKLANVGIDERSASVRENAFGNVEPRDNIVGMKLATTAPLARLRSIVLSHFV